jgi:hypothetical protein
MREPLQESKKPKIYRKITRGFSASGKGSSGAMGEKKAREAGVAGERAMEGKGEGLSVA